MAKRNRKKPQGGVRFARVPSGGETCPFCIMLASRGAVYYTERSAGADGHYHANCRCRIVPSWNGADIEGYDPELYYDMYKHPEKYAQPKDGESESAKIAEEITQQTQPKQREISEALAAKLAEYQSTFGERFPLELYNGYSDSSLIELLTYSIEEQIPAEVVLQD